MCWGITISEPIGSQKTTHRKLQPKRQQKSLKEVTEHERITA